MNLAKKRSKTTNLRFFHNLSAPHLRGFFLTKNFFHFSVANFTKKYHTWIFGNFDFYSARDYFFEQISRIANRNAERAKSTKYCFDNAFCFV